MITRPAPPDLDAEAEVDLGRHAARVAARWWLPLLGLLLGIAVGYLFSLGGEQVYRAQAVVFLGHPFSPGGSTRLETLATTPAAVREIVTAEAAVRRASRESGMRPARLRDGITVQGMTGTQRSPQSAIVNIGVRGQGPRRVADAANVLGEEVVRAVAPYVEAKIEALERQIEISDQELASLNQRIDAMLEIANDNGGDQSERLIAATNAGILESRRQSVQQTRQDRQQLLMLARTVEEPRIIQPAVAQEVTARSRRNVIVVAAVIGLLLGLAAALAWDSVARRTRTI